MTAQLADVGDFNRRMRRNLTPARTAVAGNQTRDDQSWLQASRGIIFAVLLATPFWAAIGAAFFYYW